MPSSLDASKKEVVMGIDSFNKPEEISGIDAWCNLITRLLFMEKGSYPTDPEMGCNLYQYEFSFIDEVQDELKQIITDQIRTYLPDIPFDSVDIRSTTSDSGRIILLIIIKFVIGEGQFTDSVIAVEERSKQPFFNYEVVP